MLKINTLLLGMLLCVSLSVGRASASQSVQAEAPAVVDKVEAERWREDLRYMAEEMPKRHKNLFHTMTREQFEGAVKRLHERIPSLARHQIIVEMARIVAMVGDGHTNIAPTRDPKIGFHSLPVKLYLFKDGLFIRVATREYAALVGARVIKVGAVTADEAVTRASEIIGHDNEMDIKFFAPLLLSMPEVLHALGLIESVDEARFVVEKQGQQQTIRLKAAGLAEMMPPDTDTSWLTKPGWVGQD